MKYLIIAITSRSSLTQIVNTYEGPLYRSNKIVQSFVKDYYRLFKSVLLKAIYLNYIGIFDK